MLVAGMVVVIEVARWSRWVTSVGRGHREAARCLMWVADVGRSW